MRKSKGNRVDIQIATARRGVPHASRLRAWAHAALPKNASVCIRVVGKAESRRLNRQWRGRDKPTNVLSFPSDLRNHWLLGDLAICAPVVAREAREQGKSLSAHWAHMVLHGILHLLGHDHVKNRDAKKMERCEVEILAQFGYQDPYLRS